MASYNLSINGKTYKVEADPKMPLLWVIRELAGFTEQNMVAVWRNAVHAQCI